MLKWAAVSKRVFLFAASVAVWLVISVGAASSASRSCTITTVGCLVTITHDAKVCCYQWTTTNSVVFQGGRNELFTATGRDGRIATIDQQDAVLWPQALSPDRSKVVYTTFAGPFSYPISIKLVSVNGGTPTELYRYPHDTDLQGPMWRTDGQRIAYTNDWGGGEIATIPATGGLPTVLIPADGKSRKVVGYLASGFVIVLETNRDGSNGRLLRVAEDGTTRVLTTKLRSAAVSPNGETAAFANKEGNLYAMSTSGGPIVPLAVSGATPLRIQFSPDSSKVAFTVLVPNTDDYRTYVAKTDGTRVVQLPYRPHDVSWASNSHRLVMSGWNADGQRAIATVNADGTGLTELLQTACGGPIFSPDGAYMACLLQSNQGETSELAAMRLR